MAKKTDKQHSENFEKLLKGKTIKSVSYMSEKDAEKLNWHSRPLIIWFTDGSYLFPKSDDEGNNGGAMILGDDKDYKTIYVL